MITKEIFWMGLLYTVGFVVVAWLAWMTHKGLTMQKRGHTTAAVRQRKRTWLQRQLFGDIDQSFDVLMKALDTNNEESRQLRRTLQEIAKKHDPLLQLVKNMRDNRQLADEKRADEASGIHSTSEPVPPFYLQCGADGDPDSWQNVSDTAYPTLELALAAGAVIEFPSGKGLRIVDANGTKVI